MGVASAEDIDKGCKFGLGHPMGPFSLMDMVGLDLNYISSMEAYRASGDPRDKPSPAVVEKYAKGEFGKKTGKGFYEYPAK
jgi:3-hydroxybutyryl-CoA dehydrogenase